jgi:hypothetical protein
MNHYSRAAWGQGSSYRGAMIGWRVDSGEAGVGINLAERGRIDEALAEAARSGIGPPESSLESESS